MIHRKTFLSTLAFSASMAYSAVSPAVSDEEFNELKARFEALAEAVEENASNSGNNRVSIGGYGELHYNNWEQNDAANTKKKILDFHRFVLFFGYEFTDSIRFHSEVEIEHALVKDTADGTGPGELELEQAYVEFDLTDNMEAKGGLFLIPVGIINETHEPPRFYGVERNPVEKNIIPATWWEGGAELTGRIGMTGLSYNLSVSSGLDGGTNIRGGRQKGALANATDLAYTGRLKYTGVRGLELAGTVNYQSNMAQSTDPTIGAGTLLSAHAIYDIGPVNLRALYAGWDIEGSGASSTEKDKQDGYYLEASYRPIDQVGVFTRYNVWDNGGIGDTEQTQLDIGVNYWPHEDVVIKFDIQNQENGAAKTTDELDGFNLGIGYQF